MRTHRELSLTTRVVLINALVLVLATGVLAFSPATVSQPLLPPELVVLVCGLAVVIAANSLLVGAALRPVERLIRQLDHARTTDPSERLPVPPSGIAGSLAVAVNDLLGRIEAGQRESNVRALAAQEAERARVAQELHDGVGQSLTALLLEIGMLVETTPTQEAMEELREATRASLEEVRGVARRLRPHVLEDLGLRSALTSLTTELFKHGDVHVRRDLASGLPPLDEATELVVFRVAQEALTNVARHARASNVELALTRQEHDLVLTVHDDGVGLPPGRGGTGLRGMHERALLIDASLDVRRGPRGGTLVRLAVPLGPS